MTILSGEPAEHPERRQRGDVELTEVFRLRNPGPALRIGWLLTVFEMTIAAHPDDDRKRRGRPRVPVRIGPQAQPL